LVQPAPVVATASPQIIIAKPVSADAAAVVPSGAPVLIKPSAPEKDVQTTTTSPTLADALAHFAFDSAELTEGGRTMLDAWLAQTPAALPIQITGHADRLGPEPYNDKLSLRRAEAIKKYLIEKGKPAAQIQIIARGEAVPVINCAGDANPATKACLAPNRRAEIIAKPVAKPATKPTAVAKTSHKAKVKAVKKAGKPAKAKPAH
jgi:OOP family OmpA-OmpF porin